MGDKEWDPADVLDVFGDRLARQILVIASERPVSADDITAELDVSQPTVYRRTNALVEYDLLRESTQIDTDGNHFQTFETTLKRVSFEIEDGGYAIDLAMRQRLADQFESFWSDLEGSQPEHRLGTERTDRDPSEAGGDG